MTRFVALGDKRGEACRGTERGGKKLQTSEDDEQDDNEKRRTREVQVRRRDPSNTSPVVSVSLRAADSRPRR